MGVAALIGLAACSATRLTNVWKNPGYSGGPFRQVAVFVLGTDEAVRHLVENEFVRRLPMNTRGLAGYGIVPVAEQGDVDKARERIRAGGSTAPSLRGWLASRHAGVGAREPPACADLVPDPRELLRQPVPGD